MSEKIGATGKYPDGKMSKFDEGEIAFAVGADLKHNLVILDFGKPVVWVGMTAEDAEGLADLLILKATEVKRLK